MTVHRPRLDRGTFVPRYVYRTKRLKRYGWKPDKSDEWEIHGPHYPNMPKQVYVGYAREIGSKYGAYVSIRPRAVYEVEDSSRWGDTYSENKLGVKYHPPLS